MDKLTFIKPDWPVPDHIKAFTTTRMGGISPSPYDSFNLGDHVGDDPNAVSQNRFFLKESLQLPTDPSWLQQVHGNHIISADSMDGADNVLPKIEADGSFSLKKNSVCVIMTADCLPLLLTDKAGKMVMALHGGWRSLAAGIIKKGISVFEKFDCCAADLMVWLGPAIGPEVYEVGQEVKDQFSIYEAAFKPSLFESSKKVGAAKKESRWLMDIYAIAKMQLNACGVTEIYGGDHCTYKESELFYSHRRDGKQDGIEGGKQGGQQGGQTGRMASLIWL